MNDASFKDILGFAALSVLTYLVAAATIAAPLLMLVLGALSTANGLEWIPAIGYAPSLGLLIVPGLFLLPTKVIAL